MSAEEWKAVKEQVEVIAEEVVAFDRTDDVLVSLKQRMLLTEADMTRLLVSKGRERGLKSCYERRLIKDDKYKKNW